MADSGVKLPAGFVLASEKATKLPAGFVQEPDTDQDIIKQDVTPPEGFVVESGFSDIFPRPAQTVSREITDIKQVAEQVKAGAMPAPVQPGFGLISTRLPGGFMGGLRRELPRRPSEPEYITQLREVHKGLGTEQEKDETARTITNAEISNRVSLFQRAVQSPHTQKEFQDEAEELKGKFLSKSYRRWERGSAMVVGGGAHLAEELTKLATLGKYGDTAGDYAKMYHDVLNRPEMVPVVENVIDRYVGGAIETAPFILTALAPAALTSGATIPSSIAGFLTAYAVEGNNAYQRARNRGEPERLARVRGIAVGLINGGIEVSGGSGGKYFKSRNAAIKAVATKLGKAKIITRDVLENALKEGLREELPQEAISMVLGGDVPRKMDGSVDLDAVASRLVDSAIMGTIVGGLVGAPISTVSTYKLSKRLSTHPDVSEETLERIDKMSPEELAQLDKDLFGRSLSEIVPEGSNVYKTSDGRIVVETPSDIEAGTKVLEQDGRLYELTDDGKAGDELTDITKEELETELAEGAITVPKETAWDRVVSTFNRIVGRDRAKVLQKDIISKSKATGISAEHIANDIEITSQAPRIISRFPQKIVDQTSLEEIGNAMKNHMGLQDQEIIWKIFDKKGGDPLAKTKTLSREGNKRVIEISIAKPSGKLVGGMGLKITPEIAGQVPRKPGEAIRYTQATMKRAIVHELGHVVHPPKVFWGDKETEVHHEDFVKWVDEMVGELFVERPVTEVSTRGKLRISALEALKSLRGTPNDAEIAVAEALDSGEDPVQAYRQYFSDQGRLYGGDAKSKIAAERIVRRIQTEQVKTTGIARKIYTGFSDRIFGKGTLTPAVDNIIYGIRNFKGDAGGIDSQVKKFVDKLPDEAKEYIIAKANQRYQELILAESLTDEERDELNFLDRGRDDITALLRRGVWDALMKREVIARNPHAQHYLGLLPPRSKRELLKLGRDLPGKLGKFMESGRDFSIEPGEMLKLLREASEESGGYKAVTDGLMETITGKQSMEDMTISEMERYISSLESLLVELEVEKDTQVIKADEAAQVMIAERSDKTRVRLRAKPRSEKELLWLSRVIPEALGLDEDSRIDMMQEVIGRKSMETATPEERERFVSHLERMAEQQGIEIEKSIIDRAVEQLKTISKKQKELTPTEETHLEFHRTKLEKISQEIKGWSSELYHELMRIERFLESLDGEENGVLYENIWKPTKAADELAVDNAFHGVEVFQEVLEDKGLDISLMMGRPEIISPGVELTRMQQIGVYNKSKNENGLRYVKEGMGISDADIAKISNGLTDTEKELAGWFLDQWRAYRPLIIEVAESIGMDTKELLNELNYSTLIRKDISPSEDAEFTDVLTDQFAQESLKPEQGFLEKRKKRAVGKIELDEAVSYLTSMHRIERFLAMAPVAKKVGAILKNKEFKTALNDATYGHGVKLLNTWMLDSIKGYVSEDAGRWNKTLSILRRNAVMYAIAWNIPSAMRQALALFNAAAVNPMMLKYLPINIAKATEDFKRLETEVKHKSGTVRHRDIDRDLRHQWTAEAIEKRLKGEKDPFDKRGMAWLKWMDHRTVVVAWKSFYDVAIAKGKSEKEAVGYAEKWISRTQEMGSTKDLPALFRGGTLAKIITTFENQVNNQFNFYAYDIIEARRRGDINNTEVAYRVMFSHILPAILMGMIGRGGLPKTWKQLLTDLVTYPIASLMLIGRIINRTIEGFRNSSSIIEAGPEALVRTGQAVAKGKLREFITQAATAIGAISGKIPAQVIRTIGGAYDLATGDTKDPRRLIWSKWALEQGEKKLEGPPRPPTMQPPTRRPNR